MHRARFFLVPASRRLLVAALAACLATIGGLPATAQWTLESPVPTHLEVRGVAAPTVERVFLATTDNPFDDAGALFESTDGGATWTHRDIPTNLGDPLNGIAFFDAQRGWAWGNRNVRTTDGGTTWTEMTFLGSTYSMDFATADIGLASTNGGLWMTLDGGVTWSPPWRSLFACDFFDAAVGVCLVPDDPDDDEDVPGIYRTIDAGSTFGLAEAGAPPRAVTVLDATTAVAVVDDRLLRTTDAGVTWTAVAGPGGSVAGGAEGRHRLSTVSPTVVLAWGRSGSPPSFDDRVFRSADAGATWTDLGTLGTSELVAVTAADASNASITDVVVAERAGDLHHSADDGATWSLAYASPGPTASFFSSAVPSFPSGQEGRALVGYYGLGNGHVLRTDDGGASWRQISSGAAASLLDLARFPTGELLAVGEHGAVLTRTAQDDDWTLTATLGQQDLVAVQTLESGDAVTVDERGVLFHTTDFGATWQTAGTEPPSDFTALDLHFANLLDGWVIGRRFGDAALFKTTDGGATWTPEPDLVGYFVAVDFEGGNFQSATGWAGTLDSRIFRSGNGGNSWSEIAQLPTDDLFNLDFADDTTGFALTASTAYRSTDAGDTWQPLPTPADLETFTDLHVESADVVWLVTIDGTTLYTETAGDDWAVMTPLEVDFPSYAAVVASPATETSDADAWIAGWLGSIQRFDGPPPPPVNQPPMAEFEFSAFGFVVEFTDLSTDNDGTIVSWQWDFGDGATSTAQNPLHEYASADTYHARLTVTDDDGDTASWLRFVTVQELPGGTFGDLTEVTPLDPLFVTPQNEDFWVSSAAPADIDGDGDLDLAVFGFYVVYNESVVHRLVILRNDGQVSPTEWEITYTDVDIGDLTSGRSDLAWGDADNDGDPDLVVGSEGQTVFFRNANGMLVRTGIPLPGYLEDNDQADFDLRSITWADYDNDGDVDLLIPSVFDFDTFTYRTALMRNDGGNDIVSDEEAFVEVDVGLDPTRHAITQWADDDRDGDLDLLVTHLAPLTDDGFVRRYRNDGGTFTADDPLPLRPEHGEVQWGDADADGDLDILVAGRVRDLIDGVYRQVLRLYRNDADVFTAEEILDCPQCEGWVDLSAASWADYDSDGDIDILLAGSHVSDSQVRGRAWVYRNDGSGTFTPSATQLPAPRSSGSRGGSFTWADLDVDGDLDYFVAGQYVRPGGNGLVEAQMHLYRNDVESPNDPPTAPTVLGTQPALAGPGGTSIELFWNPAADDLTPQHALTYDLELYRDRVPVGSGAREPEPGDLGQGRVTWTLTDLPDGVYTWKLRAVDSAFNAGPPAESSFVVGTGGLVFGDGFESGDLSSWSVSAP